MTVHACRPIRCLHIAASFLQDGPTPLHIAASAFLQYGYTPLHTAASSNSKETAVLLLEKGADKDAKNNNGETPLRIAALYKSEETAALLLEKGADKDAKNNAAVGTQKTEYFEETENLYTKGLKSPRCSF